MTVATSLIPGLDEIVKQRRSQTPRRGGAPDRRAVPAGRREFPARSRRSVRRRSDQTSFRTPNSPRAPIWPSGCRSLPMRRAAWSGSLRARGRDIAIAGPLLRRSPVHRRDGALIEIARMKGQGHLLAMSERPALSPDLTDVIVRRGDREVVRRAAGNAGALFSQDRIFGADQARRPGWRADARGRSARRSLGSAA